jgi:RNAse (barnase) inhibitor barstar
MTVLSTLPPQAVHPLGELTTESVRRAARTDAQRFLHADCAAAADKDGVMAALARGLKLPRHFGRNLDALYDCVTDLEPGRGGTPPGLVLVIEHLPATVGFDATQLEALLAVFTDAADDFAARGVGFRVFWSVRSGDPASP